MKSTCAMEPFSEETWEEEVAIPLQPVKNEDAWLFLQFIRELGFLFMRKDKLISLVVTHGQ